MQLAQTGRARWLPAGGVVVADFALDAVLYPMINGHAKPRAAPCADGSGSTATD